MNHNFRDVLDNGNLAQSPGLQSCFSNGCVVASISGPLDLMAGVVLLHLSVSRKLHISTARSRRKQSVSTASVHKDCL